MFFNLFKSNSKRKLPKNLGKKRIVCIGGGTGQFSVLSGLKEYAKTRKNITAIVTTIHGKIPKLQDAAIGSYSDSVPVTLTY